MLTGIGTLDRSYTAYYYLSYLTLNIIVTLKCVLEVTQVIENGTI